MTYSKEAVQKLLKERSTVLIKKAQLYDRYMNREYTSAEAKEFAHNGYLRRVKTLARCITNVFNLLPPDSTDVPEDDTRHDAEINLHAFVFNTYGAVDNLAWIWVKEKIITKENGKPLTPKHIGLRKYNDQVRKTLSADFNERLEEFEQWFEGTENYRHALAHRIPLYIPPYTVLKDSLQAYSELEQRKASALGQGNLDDYEILDAKQKELATFKSWIKHSFLEKSSEVYFHAQMLADYNTIHDLGLRMDKELG